MRNLNKIGLSATLVAGGLAALVLPACGDSKKMDPWNVPARIDEGREAFRHDTFGDEQFWTGTLKMNRSFRPRSIRSPP